MILEVLFDDGLLFFSLRNIGGGPATSIRVKFSDHVLGLDGTTDVTALPVFTATEFLGPGREIVTFVDSAASYFAHKQPAQLVAQVVWEDGERGSHEAQYHHNLEIYRDLPYVPGRPKR